MAHAAEAGAESGLPSCNALPAFALAQERLLEAPLLNTFLAPRPAQIERDQTTTRLEEKTTGTYKTLCGHTVGMPIRSQYLELLGGIGSSEKS